MICRLPFGRDHVAVDLRGFRVRALRPSRQRSAADPAALVAGAIDAPLEGPPLAELARGRARAAVVVPDATRSVDLPTTLPPILDRLARGGVASERIVVVVACGTHPAVGEEAVRELVGDVGPGVTVIQHDSRDPEQLAPAGRLPDGADLLLSKWVVEADLVITLGGVRHHYFAGFGGGPKMLFPGVGSYDQIQRNHARVIRETSTGWERVRACEPGRLVGNPVAEEIAAAADCRPPDLAVCLVPGAPPGFAEAWAGPWRPAFERAVASVRSAFEVDEGPFDLVVASGGGHPSDATLIQAHKGLDAACRFAAPGARILYVAAMGEGAGSRDMAPFLADPRPEEIQRRLAEGWVQYGHTAWRLVQRTGECTVQLHSKLAEDLQCRLGFEPAPAPEAVVAGWRQEFEGATVGVIAEAAVYPPAQ